MKIRKGKVVESCGRQTSGAKEEAGCKEDVLPGHMTSAKAVRGQRVDNSCSTGYRSRGLSKVHGGEEGEPGKIQTIMGTESSLGRKYSVVKKKTGLAEGKKRKRLQDEGGGVGGEQGKHQGIMEEAIPSEKGVGGSTT